jgi:hypothetical protein
MTEQKHKNLRIYEAIAHEHALDAAERRELTPRGSATRLAGTRVTRW